MNEDTLAERRKKSNLARFQKSNSERFSELEPIKEDNTFIQKSRQMAGYCSKICIQVFQSNTKNAEKNREREEMIERLAHEIQQEDGKQRVFDNDEKAFKKSKK